MLAVPALITPFICPIVHPASLRAASIKILRVSASVKSMVEVIVVEVSIFFLYPSKSFLTITTLYFFFGAPVESIITGAGVTGVVAETTDLSNTG